MKGHMKIAVVGEELDTYTFYTSGDNPLVCQVSNIHFSEHNDRLQLQIDWLHIGKYSKGRGKKMIARTILKALKFMVNKEMKQHRQKDLND